MEAALIVIPARWNSSRFPGKPLAALGATTVLGHVIERARRVKSADGVIVATDDQRIVDYVHGLGVEAIMTDSGHETGTDRVAEAADHFEHEIIINLQGDEPTLDPGAVDALIQFVDGDPNIDMATLARRSADSWARSSLDVVKVEVNELGKAVRFFRGAPEDADEPSFLHHVGIYAFRSWSLRRFASLPRTSAEIEESLEQLRALEGGISIDVLETSYVSHGVDRPEDLDRVARMMDGA